MSHAEVFAGGYLMSTAKHWLASKIRIGKVWFSKRTPQNHWRWQVYGIARLDCVALTETRKLK
jgi:hypothetical protein